MLLVKVIITFEDLKHTVATELGLLASSVELMAKVGFFISEIMLALIRQRAIALRAFAQGRAHDLIIYLSASVSMAVVPS